MGNLGLQRFAVLYPEDKYGKSYASTFAEVVEQFGGELTDAQHYEPGQTDFGVQIQSFVHGYQTVDEQGHLVSVVSDAQKQRHGMYRAIIDFEALFIPDSAFAVGLIAPQLQYHDIDNVLLMGTNIWQSGRIEKEGGRYVEGAVFPVGFDAESAYENVREFVVRFEEESGVLPGFIEAAAYDASMIFLTELLRSEVRSRQDLMLALKAIRNYEGLTGKTSFDPFGEAVKRLDLYQITQERAVMLSWQANP
jgi:ABC-type branched-subunit amino acid transport system substrate-binding protein